MHHWTRRSILKAAGSTAAVGAGLLANPATASADGITSESSPRTGNRKGTEKQLTLFYNGSILTMDPARPRASAVLVSGRQIKAVGGRELRSRAQGARLIDLQGRTLMPGINDSHFHFAQYALTRPPLTVDLSGITSIAELQSRLQQAVALRDEQPSERESWIKCFGLNMELLPSAEQQSLNRRDLDVVSGRHPVSIREYTSHITFINTRALELAGITGGEDPGVVVDAQGQPTGVLNEGAQSLINSVEPPYTAEDHREALPRAFETLHRLGVTSYTEPVLGPGMGAGTGLGPDTLAFYEELARSGELPMRVDVQLAPVAQSGGRAEDFRRYLDETWKPLQGIKGVSD